MRSGLFLPFSLVLFVLFLLELLGNRPFVNNYLIGSLWLRLDFQAFNLHILMTLSV